MKSNLLVFSLMGLTLLGCSKDKDPGAIIVNLTHMVDNEELVLESRQYPALSGHTYSVHRLKYYISNLRLVKEDGTFFDPAVVHYCDISEEETNRFQLDNVPAGTYRGISFTYGLDESLNVDDGLPRTQTNINMEWPIPGDQGYHYMKFEGKYDSLGTGVIKNFNLHTGATMGNQNYIDFNFDIPAISIDGNQWSIDLVMDLNEWLQNPHTWDFATYGPMIMMKQDAQEVLKANGKTVFTVASVVKD